MPLDSVWDWTEREDSRRNDVGRRNSPTARERGRSMLRPYECVCGPGQVSVAGDFPLLLVVRHGVADLLALRIGSGRGDRTAFAVGHSRTTAAHLATRNSLDATFFDTLARSLLIGVR